MQVFSLIVRKLFVSETMGKVGFPQHRYTWLPTGSLQRYQYVIQSGDAVVYSDVIDHGWDFDGRRVYLLIYVS